VLVIQHGDFVNNNAEREWQNAWAAVHVLQWKLPYALAPGNRDHGPIGDASLTAPDQSLLS
jgi:hypothetical protein